MSDDDSLPLCLFGAGGHGRVVGSQAAKAFGNRVCFADDAIGDIEEIDGIPIKFCGLEGIKDHRLIITIGDNKIRQKRQLEAINLGHLLTSFIANSQNFYASAPGRGSMILQGAIVNVGAKIGEGVILNSGAVVEHDCAVGSFAHLSPGSVMSGGSQIGACSWLGTNACIIPGKFVTDNVIIGAGAVVTHDITVAGTYVGIPARQIG